MPYRKSTTLMLKYYLKDNKNIYFCGSRKLDINFSKFDNHQPELSELMELLEADSYLREQGYYFKKTFTKVNINKICNNNPRIEFSKHDRNIRNIGFYALEDFNDIIWDDESGVIFIDKNILSEVMNNRINMYGNFSISRMMIIALYIQLKKKK